MKSEPCLGTFYNSNFFLQKEACSFTRCFHTHDFISCAFRTDPPEDAPEERGKLGTNVLAPAPAPACCQSAPHFFLRAPFLHSPGGASSLCSPKPPTPPFLTDVLGWTQPQGGGFLASSRKEFKCKPDERLEQKQVYLAKRISKKSHSHTEWPTLLSREGREAPAVSRRFIVLMGNCWFGERESGGKCWDEL